MKERITTAGIFIKNNKVLVAKRKEEGVIGGKWEFPGGKNRYGESVGETLKREFQEELGVSVSPADTIMSFDFINKETLYHQKAVLIDSVEGEFDLKFHSEIKMCDKEELLSLDFADSDRQMAVFLVENKLL